MNINLGTSQKPGSVLALVSINLRNSAVAAERADQGFEGSPAYVLFNDLRL